jgi:microcystin degradation protein MlrC
VVLADHSDRSGSATWILQQVIAQDLSDVLLATIADRTAAEAVRAKGLKGGDPFDMDMGGLADESAGQCGSGARSRASRRSPAGCG